MPLNLFTRNHDTVLERTWLHLSIEYTADRITGIDYRFGRQKSLSNPPEVRLFKLHGSWNWFRYEQSAAIG